MVPATQVSYLNVVKVASKSSGMVVTTTPDCSKMAYSVRSVVNTHDTSVNGSSSNVATKLVSSQVPTSIVSHFTTSSSIINVDNSNNIFSVKNSILPNTSIAGGANDTFVIENTTDKSSNAMLCSNDTLVPASTSVDDSVPAASSIGKLSSKEIPSCASKRSVKEAELHAQQKQLELQRQLQQIHGGLSRAVAGSAGVVKQFRLSQQQMASLLAHSSARATSSSPTSLRVSTLPILSSPLANSTSPKPLGLSILSPDAKHPSQPSPTSNSLEAPSPRTQREQNTKRKLERDDAVVPLKEAMNGYKKLKTAPLSSTNLSRIKDNICDTSSNIRESSFSPGTSLPSLSSNSFTKSNNNKFSVYASSVDTNDFSSLVLTNAKVSSILKDITIPEKSEASSIIKGVKPAERSVSSILKDHSLQSRALLVNSAFNRRVSFSPETVECSTSPSKRVKVEGGVEGPLLHKALNSLSATGAVKNPRLLADKKNYSRKCKFIVSPKDTCEDTSGCEERGKCSPKRGHIPQQSIKSEVEEKVEQQGSRCAGVRIYPHTPAPLPGDSARCPRAVLRLRDLHRRGRAALDLLPAGACSWWRRLLSYGPL